MAGKVILVGAGPGDPGLITVRGLSWLATADVVVYDYLAAPELLAQAKPGAKLVYVGKKGGDHTLPQEGINRLIVNEAKAGALVVRLKGGDPFIFGRGGEEAEELVEAGIEFEVVPGVSSAIAAPAYAGIPLTHRAHTTSVAFVTGHEEAGKETSGIAWDHLATGIGTLVFLMGVKNLPDICAELVKNGRRADTPAALVRWGTRPEQQTVTGTLGDIVAKARKAKIKPPAVFVVGTVVSLRSSLNWFENRPLFGRKILVTRSRAQASALVDQLGELGASCVEAPSIEITPPSDYGPMDRAIENLGEFDWVAFTSANGVESFFRRLFSKGKDARALGAARIAAIGPATAEKIREFGLLTDLIPEAYQAESVAEAFSRQPMTGKKVLLARAAKARTVIPDELSKMGAHVTEVTAYETMPSPFDGAALAQRMMAGEIDMVTFTSSSTVENFVAAIPPDMLGPAMEKTTAAAIGPITAKTAEKLGIKPAVVSREFTIPGLVAAIRSFYGTDKR
ncbi:MAG: uroporphyrinogen-III C-methyltransferase [Thermodesulfobacteriota bacterium]